MMPRTNITKQTTRGQIRASKLVPITPPVVLETHSSPREAKPPPSTRNKEHLAMARSKDMSVVLISIRLSLSKKILY